MADLVVVTGPPGAGKSTVARAVSRCFDPSALVAGDDFFAFVDRGFVAPWTEAAHHQNEVVVGAAAAAAGRLVAGGYTVVYDGVIGPWFLDAFSTATGLAGYHYVVLLPDERVCVERVRSRTGHGFTDVDATRHMHRQFAEAISSGTVDERHVIRAAGSAEELASSVADRVRDGWLRRSGAGGGATA